MRYAKIQEIDIANGTGVGMCLFVQGCNRHCKGCFNASTWDFKGGSKFDGKTFDKLIKLVSRPYIARLSVLGGEPFEGINAKTVFKISEKIKKRFPEKEIWVYTGHTIHVVKSRKTKPDSEDEYIIHFHDCIGNEYVIDSNRCYIDVIVDGAYDEDKKDITLAFRGSKNQRIIDVKESLRLGKVVVRKI